MASWLLQDLLTNIKVACYVWRQNQNSVLSQKSEWHVFDQVSLWLLRDGLAINIFCIMLYRGLMLMSFTATNLKSITIFSTMYSNNMEYIKIRRRKWKHFVRSGNVLTILQGNDLNLDLWPWPCGKSRSSIWLTFDPNIRVCINDIRVLVSYQGQGQRSTQRSLHSKIVKTFLVLTFCFHSLQVDQLFDCCSFARINTPSK